MNENNIADDELIYKFYKDVKYDLSLAGDKRSNRYNYIKKLETKSIRATDVEVIFLSSNPNVLVDRLHLLYQEKLSGNDSNIINDEMIAIYDKLYEYSIITKSDHIKMLEFLE